MNDEATPTPSGKVPGRGDYKGLYRSDPAALTTEQHGDVLPPISIGLSDLLGGIDGTGHGRRRVYNLSDEPTASDHLCAAPTEPTVDDDAQADAHDDDADVLTAEADETEGLEL